MAFHPAAAWQTLVGFVNAWPGWVWVALAVTLAVSLGWVVVDVVSFLFAAVALGLLAALAFWLWSQGWGPTWPLLGV